MKFILPILVISLLHGNAFAEESKVKIEGAWDAEVSADDEGIDDHENFAEMGMSVEETTFEAKEEKIIVEPKAPAKPVKKAAKKSDENETLCSEQNQKFGKSKWEQAKNNFSNYNILMGISNTFNSAGCFVIDYGSDPKQAADDLVDVGGKAITTAGSYAKKAGSAAQEALEKNPKKNANHEEIFSLTPKYGAR